MIPPGYLTLPLVQGLVAACLWSSVYDSGQFVVRQSYVAESILLLYVDSSTEASTER